MILCEECRHNPATIYRTTIINGVKKEQKLCAVCAAQYGYNIGYPTSSINNILSGLFSLHPKQDEEPERRCSNCGRSLEAIKKTGLVGCSSCYQDFHKELEPVLRRVQGRLEHIGLAPDDSSGERERDREIHKLKRELDEAVEREHYEEAAVLRDKIAELKNGPAGE
mgnify:CR=1 FL=1